MCISINCVFILYFYVINLALWIQDFNKLTCLLTNSLTEEKVGHYDLVLLSLNVILFI